jgi:hypothetical protein
LERGLIKATNSGENFEASRTRLLLDAALNRGVERKKKIGPQFGPDVGRPTSVWDHPG